MKGVAQRMSDASSEVQRLETADQLRLLEGQLSALVTKTDQLQPVSSQVGCVSLDLPVDAVRTRVDALELETQRLQVAAGSAPPVSLSSIDDVLVMRLGQLETANIRWRSLFEQQEQSNKQLQDELTSARDANASLENPGRLQELERKGVMSISCVCAAFVLCVALRRVW
eukprot:GDKI01014084.1.p1 GENE.GDKI01014084.1~~GDKI01014084.1.p1  ORF type:complete len:170 (+),score=31.18 GDKI01014084.1:74-583(+)